MSEFLAIDPGTINLGWAVFEGERHGERPKHVGTLTAPATLTAVLRSTIIIDFITTELLVENPGIMLVACEVGGWAAANPQLKTLVVALGQTIRKMALVNGSPKKTGDKRQPRLEWRTYHNQTVFASVARGMPRSKQSIRTGCVGLYPELRTKMAKYNPNDIQDAWDAVAVGHCHIVTTKTKELEGPS